MSNKAIGIVAYITIIGWLIALIVHKGKDDKSAAAGFQYRAEFWVDPYGNRRCHCRGKSWHPFSEYSACS